MGEFIAENRKKLGITQYQLAEKLFVTNKAVSKWENGRSFPDITMFEPLAAELGITVSELISCQWEKAADEASIKDILRLSGDVVKRCKKGIIIAFTAFSIILLCLTGRTWRLMVEERNMEYLYWQGFYYTPENGSVDEDMLGSPVGTVTKAGVRGKNNHGGDSNCADPGSGIYYVNADDAYYRGTLASKIDGEYKVFRLIFSDRQELEKYNRYNIRGEIKDGRIYEDQIY